MLLAVDVGNTNLLFALVDGETIVQRWRITTDHRRTADEYAVWLLQLFEIEGYARDCVDGVIIGSVVPRAMRSLEILATKYFKVEPVIAGRTPEEWGVELDVEEPASVGADRVINAIAAHDAFPGDLVIIDFGTATTFDVVDFSGAYKGGVISPGINLSLDALFNATAKLPRIALEAPKGNLSVIGRTTEDQMHIGVFWGYVAMVEGMVQRIRDEIGRPVKVISTGGLAVLFNEHSKVFDEIMPDLTIRGLILLYHRLKG